MGRVIIDANGNIIREKDGAIIGVASDLQVACSVLEELPNVDQRRLCVAPPAPTSYATMCSTCSIGYSRIVPATLIPRPCLVCGKHISTYAISSRHESLEEEERSVD